MLARALSVAVVGLSIAISIGLIGCGKKDAASTAPAAGESRTATYHGITFDHPADWTPAAMEAGLDVRAPVTDDTKYPAAIYFDVRDAGENKDLAKLLDALADNVQGTVHVTSKQVLSHPSGFQYGRLAYTKIASGEGTRLTGWELYIPLADSKQLYIEAKAPTELWAQYEPAFTKIIDSIHLPAK